MNPFRLIVFDLDGTLVDSRRDIADAANTLLADCGGVRLPEDTIGRMVGDGAATLVARAFAAVPITPPADALQRFLKLYEARLLVHTRPYSGVPQVLAHLSAGTSLAVLTNKPLGATREILAGLDLEPFFERDAVVGGDGPFPRKPDPGGLRFLCARVDVAPACALMVGDSIIDWRTAKNAGTSVCLVRYGFGFETIDPLRLGPEDHLIDAPAALLRLSEKATRV